MNTTEETDKLVLSLAKAKIAFGVIARDKQVEVKSDKGAYKFKYAPLETILAAVTGALSEQELTIINGVEYAPDGSVLVLTRLAHASGQWIQNAVNVGKNERLQALGSALTYGRRYGITMTLGIQADDDDDGNGAEVVEPKRQRAQEKEKPALPAQPNTQPDPTPAEKNSEQEQKEHLLRAIQVALDDAGYGGIGEDKQSARMQLLFDTFATSGRNGMMKLSLGVLQAGYTKLKYELQQLAALPKFSDNPVDPRQPPQETISDEELPQDTPQEENAATGESEAMDATPEQIAGLRLSAQQVGGDALKELEEVLAHHKKGVPADTYLTMRKYLDGRLAKAKQGALV